jgi:hypothetical protein
MRDWAHANPADAAFFACWNYIKNGVMIGIRESGHTYMTFQYITIAQGSLRPEISSVFYIENAFDGYLDATRILLGQ